MLELRPLAAMMAGEEGCPGSYIVALEGRHLAARASSGTSGDGRDPPSSAVSRAVLHLLLGFRATVGAAALRHHERRRSLLLLDAVGPSPPPPPAAGLPSATVHRRRHRHRLGVALKRPPGAPR